MAASIVSKNNKI